VQEKVGTFQEKRKAKGNSQKRRGGSLGAKVVRNRKRGDAVTMDSEEGPAIERSECQDYCIDGERTFRGDATRRTGPHTWAKPPKNQKKQIKLWKKKDWEEFFGKQETALISQRGRRYAKKRIVMRSSLLGNAWAVSPVLAQDTLKKRSVCKGNEDRTRGRGGGEK